MDKTGRNGLRVGDLLDKNFTTAYIKLRMKHQRLLDNYNFQEDITTWEEEFFDGLEFLKQMNIVNGEYFINNHIKAGKKVLAEGAQGSMLDMILVLFLMSLRPVRSPPGYAAAWVWLRKRSGM
jgi:adenylosuccinate synthase